MIALITPLSGSSSVSLPSTIAAAPAIQKIESLAQVSKNQPPGTIYFFDIDDTLIDFPYMLGSSAWRRYITQATKHDPSQNWHDVFSLFVTQHHPCITVEPETKAFVEELLQNYNVYGLTSRERKRWYATPKEGVDELTHGQLISVGIDLTKQPPSAIHSYLIQESEYFNGVFYCDEDFKGDYLRKMSKNLPIKFPKAIFIDDKLTHVKSVAALKEDEMEIESYLYSATEEKTKRFDPLIADIQLYHLWISKGTTVLSDDQATQIAQEQPEKTSKWYLQAVMDDFKRQVN